MHHAVWQRRCTCRAGHWLWHVAWILAQWTISTAAAVTPYVDTLIEGGTLPIDVVNEGHGTHFGSIEGPWRGVTIETRWSSGRSGSTESQGWHQVQAFHDTPNWGLLGLAISLDPAGSGFTLRQQDLPLTHVWRAYHEFGQVDLPTSELGSTATRVSLPTARAWGVSAQWEHLPTGERWLGAVGELSAAFGPHRTPYTEDRPVRFAMVGLDKTAPHQHYGLVVAGHQTGAAGLYQGLRWSEGPWAVQTQVLASRSIQSGWKTAAWTDVAGSWNQHHFSAGLRTVAANVEWLQSPLPAGDGAFARWRFQSPSGWAGAETDVQRADHSHQAWVWLSAGWRSGIGTWSGQLWHLASPEAPHTNVEWAHEVTRASGGLQWRQALQAQQTTRSAPVHWQWSTDLATEQRTGRWQLGLELPLRAALAQPRWALRAGWISPWESALSGSFSAQAQRPRGGATTASGSASLSWRFAPGWALQTLWQRDIGRKGAFSSEAHNWTVPVEASVSADKAASGWSIGLHYNWQAGRPAGGAGSGMVYGFAFFDTNRNGVFDPTERPADGVTLIINNRYSVHTDATGRYATAVPAGPDQTLRMRVDGLPLPWTPLHEQMSFSVQPREDLRLDVALVTL